MQQEELPSLVFYALSWQKKIEGLPRKDIKEIAEEISSALSEQSGDEIKTQRWGKISFLSAYALLSLCIDILSNGALRERKRFKWLNDIPEK